jgi:hypothetical protein
VACVLAAIATIYVACSIPVRRAGPTLADASFYQLSHGRAPPGASLHLPVLRPLQHALGRGLGAAQRWSPLTGTISIGLLAAGLSGLVAWLAADLQGRHPRRLGPAALISGAAASSFLGTSAFGEGIVNGGPTPVVALLLAVGAVLNLSKGRARAAAAMSAAAVVLEMRPGTVFVAVSSVASALGVRPPRVVVLSLAGVATAVFAGLAWAASPIAPFGGRVPGLLEGSASLRASFGRVFLDCAPGLVLAACAVAGNAPGERTRASPARLAVYVVIAEAVFLSAGRSQVVSDFAFPALAATVVLASVLVLPGNPARSLVQGRLVLAAVAAVVGLGRLTLSLVRGPGGASEARSSQPSLSVASNALNDLTRVFTATLRACCSGTAVEVVGEPYLGHYLATVGGGRFQDVRSLHQHKATTELVLASEWSWASLPPGRRADLAESHALAWSGNLRDGFYRLLSPRRRWAAPDGLSRWRCRACHAEPSPSQLPRSAWPSAVDRMQRLSPGLMTAQEFHDLLGWYVGHASDEVAALPPVSARCATFRAEPFSVSRGALPLVSMIRFDETTDRVLVGDATSNNLKVVDLRGTELQRIPLPGAPVAWRQWRGRHYLAVIGDFNPETFRSAIFEASWLSSGSLRLAPPLVEGSPRISDIAIVGKSPPGSFDLFVAAFGSWRKGRLAVVHVGQDGVPGPGRELVPREGAVGLAVGDLNNDRRADVLALFAQGRNELKAFLQGPDGDYEERQLLEESSSFGFNSLELADLDGDGAPEVVLVNGNNLEITPPPLRTYHGLRIYSLTGDLQLRERYHHAMHGAMRAALGDFDLDGDLDILLISLFPDWREQEPTTAVLLSNLGGVDFSPATIAPASGRRWLSVGLGDVDHDGDVDALLGGALLPGRDPGEHRRPGLDRSEDAAILLLRNRTLDAGSKRRGALARPGS